METGMLMIAIPLLLLNFLAGIIGGIGLAIQGEWRLLIGGIAWGFVGPFVLSLALLPGLIFAPLLAWADDRRSAVLGLIVGVPALLWTYCVVAASCMVVFGSIAKHGDGDLAHLLWAYSVTTAPWSVLARKENRVANQNASLLMFFAQMGVVSMMVSSWVDPADTGLARLALWFLPFMALGFAFQMFVIWVETKAYRRA